MVAFAAFMLAVPWLIPVLVSNFWVSVIAEVLIWSLFAASVNLLFGYVGLLSFGQALYFGCGMYGGAIGIESLGLSFWPVMIVGYWAIALSPSLLILGLSMRRTVRAARIQRALVRALTRYGPLSVRLLFLVFGVGLVADALVNHSALW